MFVALGTKSKHSQRMSHPLWITRREKFKIAEIKLIEAKTIRLLIMAGRNTGAKLFPRRRKTPSTLSWTRQLFRKFCTETTWSKKNVRKIGSSWEEIKFQMSQTVTRTVHLQTSINRLMAIALRTNKTMINIRSSNRVNLVVKTQRIKKLQLQKRRRLFLPPNKVKVEKSRDKRSASCLAQFYGRTHCSRGPSRLINS